MGFILSKQQAIEGDPSAPARKFRSKFKFGLMAKLKSRKGKSPPLPVVEAPWVKGHRIFVMEKDGDGKYIEPRS